MGTDKKYQLLIVTDIKVAIHVFAPMTETEQLNEEEQDEECLNSFFAKKDKSNKPKKKKKPRTEETSSKGATSEGGAPKPKKDEWHDFEEEKEKDYSGLKIQDLQVVEGAKEEGAEDGGDDCGEDEEGGNPTDNTKWNIPAAPVTAAPAPAQTKGTEIEGTQNVVGGKYVPPSVKRSNMLAQGAGSRPSSRRPLQAPDLASQAAFPTLGAAQMDLNSAGKTGDFEAVKGGTRTMDARVDDSRSSVSLGNRYGSLGRT